LLETGPKPAVIVYIGAREIERSAVTVAVYDKGSRRQASLQAKGVEEALSALETLAEGLEKPIADIAGSTPRIPGDLSYEL
jgi:threonyl-tRNA synthetase